MYGKKKQQAECDRDGEFMLRKGGIMRNGKNLQLTLFALSVYMPVRIQLLELRIRGFQSMNTPFPASQSMEVQRGRLCWTLGTVSMGYGGGGEGCPRPSVWQK